MSTSSSKKPENSPTREVSPSVWAKMSSVDVSSFTETKGSLTYLSWAHSWGALKNLYPDATFKKHLFSHEGKMLPYMKDEQGFTYVMVTVEIPEQATVTEPYPVLDHQNKAVKNPDAFAVNTAMQRCLAKCIAYLGMGYHIYAGEDLPDGITGIGKPQSYILRDVNGTEHLLLADTFRAKVDEIIGGMVSNDDLRDFYTANKDAIGQINGSSPQVGGEIIRAITNRRNTLAKLDPATKETDNG